ncbi:MAG: SH3 domain-containing protein [Flavobacteriaceae bacterium]|nr:SH3 domain-containing protein [Flavobacteriaceae bacterium]
MKNILLVLFIIVGFNSYSQAEDVLFSEANEHYINKDYESSFSKYNMILEKGLESSELFFNMANTCFKLKKLGLSIYYYEKSLQIDPLNTDAEVNLNFAKNLTIDSIEVIPQTVFQKLESNVILKISYNYWAYISLFLLISSLLLFIFYYMNNNSKMKKLLFSLFLVFGGLFIFSFMSNIKAYNYNENNKVSIVLDERVEVTNSPIDNSEEIFVLHEGTKIVVIDEVSKWKKVKLSDGKIGWVLSDSILEL